MKVFLNELGQQFFVMFTSLCVVIMACAALASVVGLGYLITMPLR